MISDAGRAGGSLSSCVEHWAHHTPDHTALKEHGTVVTYNQLAANARAIHAGLIADGTHSTHPIVVVSTSDVVRAQALIGILRAGQTYVPVDSSWPQHRISAVVAATGASLVIADAEQSQPLTTSLPPSCRVVTLDQLCTGNVRTALPAAGDDRTLASSLAWIIFTSGSSGAPKGIVQPYRNVLHYAAGIRKSLSLTAADRVGIASPLTAHGGLVYTLASALSGASLYPINPKRQSPSAIRAWIAQERISVLFLVPTVLRAMIDAATTPDDLTSIRLLRLSGETVHQSDVELFRKHFADQCVLSVGFGSTETGGISEGFFRKDAAFASSRVPVGYPVDALDVSLVDEGGRPVGDDCPGEFVVTGAHLSPGYWDRPALTTSRFAHLEGDRRRYRTGDVGIRRANGMLEHLGRLDSQVQIGGQRVELEEIEAALMRVDGVSGAAVVDARVEPTRPRLVAFYTLTERVVLGPDQIEHRLTADLPRNMIPSRLVCMPSLPTTRNGKVDRARLIGMATEAVASRSTESLPTTPLERTLTELCAEVLGVTQVGLHDNFFDSGGTSIEAAALFRQIEDRLGYRVPLATLAAAPTMGQLAARLDHSAAHREASTLVALQPLGDRPPFFCVHGWGGQVVGFYQLARHLGERQPFFGIQSKGVFGREFADWSVEQMASTYVEELLTEVADRHILLGGLSSGGLVAFEMAQQLWARGRPVALLAMFDTTPRPATRTLSASIVLEKLEQLRERVHHHVSHVVRGSPDARREYVGERLRTVRRRMSSQLWQWGMSRDAAADPTNADTWQHVREINYLALKRYRLHAYPGKVTLFKAAETSPGGSRHRDYGWRRLAQGGVDVHVVPGNHTTLITEPHVSELARQLERCIDEVIAHHVRALRPG